MTKTVAAVLALLLAAPALGTTTWTKDPTSQTPVSKLVASTGTETGDPPTLATDGLALSDLRGFTVHVEAAAAMTAGGLLLAYLWNPVTARWIRVADGSLDLTVAAIQYQSFGGFRIDGDGPVRIAYVPSGIGQASTIWIVGSR